ncbi:hypothetical protein WJX72_004291 [[Myrmecia] bisecta]|uniref:Polyketide synthase n=1 Tax=[Myrmecia] bisecta TaxID=41462 RepID=A0AAW1R772_9CHLO
MVSAHKAERGDQPVLHAGPLLITGGFGALGTLIAMWASANHCADIILVGRSGRHAGNGGSGSLLAALTRSGYQGSITMARCDVAVADECRQLTHHQRFGTILHAGGVLADALLRKQTAGTLRTVLAPKVAGTVALSRATALAPLASVGLFSSIAALLGNAGQGNYAAANGFLDGWAAESQSQGRACFSVQWGAWAGMGMAADDPGLAGRLQRAGLHMVQPADGLAVLGGLLSNLTASLPKLPATLAFSGFDWQRLLKPVQRSSPFFEEVAGSDAEHAEHAQHTQQEQHARASAEGARMSLTEVLAILRTCVEAVVGSSIADDAPLMSSGLDSLAAVELRHAVQTRFAVELPATLAFDYPTMQDMAKLVAASVKPAAVAPDQPLMQAGLDSLGAVELRNALATKFSVDVPATVAFDYPTLKALAGFVGDAMAGGRAESGDLELREVALDDSLLTQQSTSDIIGFAARYPSGTTQPHHQPASPGESGTPAFWGCLVSSADLPAVVPISRWDIDAVYAPEAASGKMYVRFGSFEDGVDAIDAAAFRLAYGEAVGMDPQARILLEQTQEVLASAGTAFEPSLEGSTGVYIGCMYTEYLDSILGPQGVADSNSNAIIGHGLSFLTTARICLLQALSPVGRCKTFDASGDGYGRGEGFTVALLRQSSGCSDGSALLAVVRGSAVNQDGRSSSLTAPNGPSQQMLVKACLEDAGLPPASLGFVSVHGTGTPLGDPIEMGALGSALGSGQQQRLAIGSSKACFGHTEGTAGVTGVLLAVKTLQQASAAPILHLRNVNPYVEAAVTDWQSKHRLSGIIVRQAAPGTGLQGGFLIPLTSAALAFMGDHVVMGKTLFAGAGLFELGFAAASSLAGDSAKLALGGASIAAPCLLAAPDRGAEPQRTLMCSIQPGDGSLEDTAGFFVHPAIGDNCIHLAAIPDAGRDVGVTRVPVAVESFSVPIRQQALATTLAESVAEFADRSTSNNMRLVAADGAVTLSIAGLLAKVMPTPAAGKATAGSAGLGNILYQQLQGLLAIKGDSISLATRSSLAGSDTACGRATAVGAAILAAAPWALLKVAAAELGYSANWAGRNLDATSALHPGDPPRDAQPFRDAHGAALQAAVWRAPRMIPMIRSASGPAVHAPATSGLPNAISGHVIISGGLGALGSLVACWLLHQSTTITKITLLGRSGRPTFAVAQMLQKALAHGQSRGCVLELAACDVAFGENAAALMACTKAGQGAPPATIIHAGGMLKDAMLGNQTAAGMRSVFAPKVAGAAQLSRHSAALPLAATVAFSSIAGLLGSGGQANYAAANAVLDAWSDTLQSQGVASVSLLWGAWGGFGMAAQEPTLMARLARLGLGAIQPAQGLAALAVAMQQQGLGSNLSTQPRTMPSARVVASVFLWDRLLPTSLGSLQNGGRQAAAETLKPAVTRPVWWPMGAAERLTWVMNVINAAVVNTIGRAVDPAEPLMSAGLDSLGSVELQKELSLLTGLDLPTTLLFDYPSIGELAPMLAAQLPAFTPDPEPAPDQAIPEWRAATVAADQSPKASGEAKANGSALPDPALQGPRWLSMDRGARRQFMRSQVLGAVKIITGVDISLDAPLMSAGLDSLGSVELRKELISITTLDLPATLVFDYPSIHDIVEYILNEFAPAPAPAAADDRIGVVFPKQAPGAITAPDEDEEEVAGLVEAVPDKRVRRLPPLNPNAPRLTKPSYFTVPPIKRLRRMTNAQLESVPRFVVGKEDTGEVMLINNVNLLGLDLDAIVDIEKGRVQVYGLAGGPGIPPIGQGLNGPAMLTFRRMHMKQKDAKSLERFAAKLREHSARAGGVFVHYDADAGVWIMKVDHF